MDLTDLPDELQPGAGEVRPEVDEVEAALKRMRDLERIGTLIAGKRDEAVRARREQGIDAIWDACEARYNGKDASNQVGDWRKPTAITGPLTRDVNKTNEAKSNVFVRLTTRYVDMGSAKVKEKALPIDDKPFELQPTPKPTLVNPPAPAAAPVGPVMQQAAPNPATAQPAVMDSVAQAAAQTVDVISAAKASADKAGNRIYDWLTESKYPTHIRRMIDDGARLGTGILRGPFPDSSNYKAVENGKLRILTKTGPAVTWVDPWNFYPAGNCGEDIHRGDHCLEKDAFSESRLLALKNVVVEGKPAYIAEQIDKVVKEGPDKAYADESKRDEAKKKGLYTVWHFFGQLGREDMEALDAPGLDELPDECKTCHAIVTLVNDTVIRAQFNPLVKTGNLPYRVFRWSRRVGSWTGVGIAEQIEVPQNMVNAGLRTWLNNAGISAGVQLVFDDAKLRPYDNSPVIGGGVKLWATTAEGSGEDVRKLMAAIEIPNLGAQLKAIVDEAYKMAEDMSNIPLISQGQTGVNDPQTFGQAELQNSNANTLLRQIGDTLDGEVFAPLIDDFYEWLLLDDDVPADEKGDFKIVATGCAAMVEKAIQEQTLMQMLGLTANPLWGQDPKKFFAKVMQSKRLDPAETEYSKEELAALQQNQPKPPQVQVAEINAGVALHKQDMGDKTKQAIAKMDSDRDVEYRQALAEQARIDSDRAIRELELRKDIAILDAASRERVSVEKIKADLAKTAMQTTAQIQLSAHDKAAPQVATPAFEPPGRAEPGHAFTD